MVSVAVAGDPGSQIVGRRRVQGANVKAATVEHIQEAFVPASSLLSNTVKGADGARGKFVGAGGKEEGREGRAGHRTDGFVSPTEKYVLRSAS